MIDQHIGRNLLQGMRSQAVGHAHGIDSGIAGGKNINVGVANNNRLFRKGRSLFQQYLDTGRIWLFGVKAVAAIDLEEIWPQAKRIKGSKSSSAPSVPVAA